MNEEIKEDVRIWVSQVIDDLTSISAVWFGDQSLREHVSSGDECAEKYFLNLNSYPKKTPRKCEKYALHHIDLLHAFCHMHLIGNCVRFGHVQVEEHLQTHFFMNVLWFSSDITICTNDCTPQPYPTSRPLRSSCRTELWCQWWAHHSHHLRSAIRLGSRPGIIIDCCSKFIKFSCHSIHSVEHLINVRPRATQLPWPRKYPAQSRRPARFPSTAIHSASRTCPRRTRSRNLETKNDYDGCKMHLINTG